jgi:hypothetical protein
MKAFFLAIPLLLSGAVALANAPAGSILVKTVAEQEQAAADGSLRLVPAAKVLPGREVVYTVTVENIGHDVARGIVPSPALYRPPHRERCTRCPLR